LLTVVRETESEARAMANKPRDYKKETAYQRENYRHFQTLLCNSDAAMLQAEQKVVKRTVPLARNFQFYIS